MEIEFGSQRRRDTREAGEAGIGAKIGLTLFLSVFFLMGAAFMAFMGHEVYKIARTYTFTKTDAVVEYSSIVTDRSQDDPFTLDVKYRYEVGGKTFRSDVYSSGDSTFSDYSDAQRELNKYSVGAVVSCYYNSNRPTEVVLVHKSLWILPFMLIPLIFVVIGGGGIYGIWFGKAADDKDSGKSISSSAPSKAGPWGKYGLAFFFFIFFAAGVGISFPLIIIPVYKHIDSKEWTRVPAVVEYSRVKSHDSDDGTTYSVDILFSYQVNGRQYKSNNYDFSSGSSSGYASKKRVVQMYPAGMRFKAFVDPEDPTDAVINRSLDTTMMLFGLLPLIFVLVGAGGMYAALTGKMQGGKKPARMRRAETAASSVGSINEAVAMAGALRAEEKGTRIAAPDLEGLPNWAPELSSYEMLPSGEVLLRPMVTAKMKIIGITVVALFWNGIIGAIMYAEGFNFSSGFGILSLLFFVPFILVGLALIGGIFYFVLAAANARPSITLRSLKVHPGEPFRLRWELAGKTENIEKFNIKIKGIEEATYRRGTDTYTDRETFYENTVAAYGKHADIRTGSADVTLPEGVMHSFACQNNRIKWIIHIHGDIKKWPDVSEEFPILVMPKSTAKGA